MARERSPIALDFRDDFVRGVQLERRADGLHVVAAHAVRLAPVAADATPADRTACRTEAGRRLLREGGFRGRAAVVAIDHDGFTTRRIRIPTERLEQAGELIAREIQDQPDADGERTILPIPVADLFDQGQTKREFLCCAARADAVDGAIAVAESLGLVPRAVDLEPCALVRPFVQRARQDSFLHLDLRRRRSSITIVRAGATVTMAPARLGCDDLAERLRHRLQLDVPSLVDLDRVPDVEHRNLHEAVARVLAEPLERLLLELSAAVRYCGSLFQGRAVTVLRTSGALAELPGLVPYLGRRIGISAEVADPFAGLAAGAVPTTAGGGRSEYCTAVGLALREAA